MMMARTLISSRASVILGVLSRSSYIETASLMTLVRMSVVTVWAMSVRVVIVGSRTIRTMVLSGRTVFGSDLVRFREARLMTV